MRSSFVTSVNVTEFHKVEADWSLGLTRVKFNINKSSRLENDSVIVTPYGVGENTVYVRVEMKF